MTMTERKEVVVRMMMKKKGVMAGMAGMAVTGMVVEMMRLVVVAVVVGMLTTVM